MATSARQYEPIATPAESRVYDDRQPIRLPDDWVLSEAQFDEICRLNKGTQFERTPDGRLYQLNAPNSLSEEFNAEIGFRLRIWAETSGGRVRGADGGYYLPDGSHIIPDTSWVDQQTLDQRPSRLHKFRAAPAFVVEVMSINDTLPAHQSKLRSWIGYGTQLGWLIDPFNEIVYIYRADGSVEEHHRPGALSGEAVCPGFTLDLERLWNPA